MPEPELDRREPATHADQHHHGHLPRRRAAVHLHRERPERAVRHRGTHLLRFRKRCGLLRQFTKNVLETALNEEMTDHRVRSGARSGAETLKERRYAVIRPIRASAGLLALAACCVATVVAAPGASGQLVEREHNQGTDVFEENICGVDVITTIHFIDNFQVRLGRNGFPLVPVHWSH